MTYDLNDPREYIQAKECLERMKERGRPVRMMVESDDFDALDLLLQCAASLHMEIQVNQKRRPKTKPQNSYLHFLCQYFAAEYGCTSAEAKEVYLKRQACPEIFQRHVINKKGKTITTYRSTADLTLEETSSAIRNFIEWSTINGIPLPLPEDKGFVRYAENEIERARNQI
jgi:hypothetical protein